jgi:4'-phosphopantetheinyl transferase
LLDPAEANRRGCERDDVWRRRVVARAALRVALGRRLGRHPRSLRFELGPHGKPELAPSAGEGPIQFSLSHSGDLCVIAISAQTPVGVDVEQVRERVHLERLVSTRLAAAEASVILGLAGKERRSAFYRVWTRKEAYLKAKGVGLSVELGSFTVSAGERPILVSPLSGDQAEWALTDLDLGEGFQGALASRDRSAGSGAAIVPAKLTV